MRGRSGCRVVASLLFLGVIAACSAREPTEATSDGGRTEGTVRVSAASSLTDAFQAMAGPFEAAHPGTDVVFTFAASSAVVQQLAAGASADVVATADGVTMQALTDRGDAADPRVFARNRLTILVGNGNPKRVSGLADLARPDVVLVLCAPEVPCGRLAQAALRAAGVSVEPASLEGNVRSVVSKVVLGEADAGIVYATDARAQSPRAEAVESDIAARTDLEAVYSVAVVPRAEHPTAARAWADFVLSDEGQAVLAGMGFLLP